MITKEARRLRVGVLGAGPIAQFAHLESCVKARNADLYAICDAAPDLLGRMAASYAPQKTFADYGAMLADPELEAVIVATSDAWHVPMSIRALARHSCSSTRMSLAMHGWVTPSWRAISHWPAPRK